MNHKVRSVQELYEDSKALYDDIITGGSDSSADSIIANLNKAIDTLKSTWEGKDAGIWIQSLVEIHNAMVALRNALCELASDSSKVAANYRNIQNANGSNLQSIGVIESSTKSGLGEYADVRDTINISPEAGSGGNYADSANKSIDEFISKANAKYIAITENWSVGTGRDRAQGAFDNFMTNLRKYKETLTLVSENVRKAISNYNF